MIVQLAAKILEHVRCQAQLAERRYQAVDPENRLFARTLEQQWEESLRELRAAEERHVDMLLDF